MFDLKVHHYQMVTDEKTKQKVERLVKYTPWKLFQTRDQPQIFLQEGRFFYENGEEISDVPPEIVAQCEAMTEEGKKIYGYKGKRGPGRPPKEA